MVDEERAKSGNIRPTCVNLDGVDQARTAAGALMAVVRLSDRRSV